MRRLNFCAWDEHVSPAFLEAAITAAGASEALLLKTWNGVEKITWDIPATDPPPAQLYVEWLTGGPGNASQVQLFGPAIADDCGEPAFGRRLARAWGKPLLFSDCHLFPGSWMMAREDGAIVHVVIRDDDTMALLPDDPADPDYWPRPVLFGPGDPLPVPTAAELAARPDPPDHCVVFGGRCPKSLQQCVHLGG
jgi:hypothetical protein